MGKGHAGTYPAAGRGRRVGREMRALARGSGTRAQPMSSSRCRRRRIRREKFHSRPSLGTRTRSGAGSSAGSCNALPARRRERSDLDQESEPGQPAAARAGGVEAEEGWV
ncbi:hypothetical protein R6Z07M_006798 [Ovis aries]